MKLVKVFLGFGTLSAMQDAEFTAGVGQCKGIELERDVRCVRITLAEPLKDGTTCILVPFEKVREMRFAEEKQAMQQVANRGPKR